MNHFLVILTAGWVSGLAVLAGKTFLDAAGFSRSGKWALGFALGLGGLGYVFTLLGLLNLFSAVVVLAVMFFLTVIFAVVQIKKKEFPPFRAWPRPSFFWCILTGVFLLALLQCLVPSTAHDAMAYHLDIPKRFVQAGGLVYVPYGVNSTFPLLMSMYYAFALLWNSTALANMLHLLHGAALAAGIVSLARGHLSRKYSVLSALIFCLTPAVFNQMTIANNDIAFACYAFYVFYALCRWDESPGWKWAFMAGVFAGFALSIKNTGAFIVFLTGLLMLFKLIRREIKFQGFVFSAAAFGAAAFLFAFIWYLRCYLYEGSLIYFGQEGYAATNQFNFWKYVFLPWLITMFPERFGGNWAQIGPVYLAFLPLLLCLKGQPRRVKTLFFFGAGYFLLWMSLPRQNLRFLLPALPFFAILISSGFSRLSGGKPLRAACTVLLFLMLVMEAGLAVYHGKEGYRAAFGIETEEEYLQKNERTFELARFMNRHIADNAKIMNVYEVRMFYINAHLVREKEYRIKTGYDTRSMNARAVIEGLKKDGFTHILWTPDYGDKSSALNLVNILSEGNVPEGMLKEIYRQSKGPGLAPAYVLFEIVRTS